MSSKDKARNGFFIFVAAALMISAVLLFKLFFISSARAVSATDAISSVTATGLAVSQIFILPVPFTAQAPLAEWRDERQEDGCEEATALMAMAWVKNESERNATNWRDKMIGLSDWEQKNYGEYRDLSLFDMLTRFFGAYFSYGNVALKSVRNVADIREELEKSHVVLVPLNGRALNNPYFTLPGPERHMVLIKGYDYILREFITNDPGTRHGENYRYPEKTLFNAIRPYKTGYHIPFGPLKKEMIVVGEN